MLFRSAHPLTPDTIYIATEDAGIFQSLDRGLRWTAFNQGIQNRQVGLFYQDSKTLWASILHDGIHGGLFQSQDGQNWKPGNLIEEVSALHRATDGKLYAGTARGFFVQTQSGSWTSLSSTRNAITPIGNIFTITSSPNTFYVGASNGSNSRFRKISKAECHKDQQFGDKARSSSENGRYGRDCADCPRVWLWCASRRGPGGTIANGAASSGLR